MRGASGAARRWMNHGATGVITVGGWATIVSVLGIFVYLLMETAPLFEAASWSKAASVDVDAGERDGVHPRHVGVGIDDSMTVGHVLRRGDVAFYALPSGDRIRPDAVPVFAPGRITAVARSPAGAHRYGLGTVDGRVIPLRVRYRVTFGENGRNVTPVVTAGEPVAAVPAAGASVSTAGAAVPTAGASVSAAGAAVPAVGAAMSAAGAAVPAAGAVARLAFLDGDDGTTVAALTASGRLFLTKVEETESLLTGERARDVRRVEITGARVGTLSALLLDGAGDTLVGGTADGRLLHWDIREAQRPRLMGTYDAGAPVTALAYLIGDRSLVVGARDGTVAVWLSMTDPGAGGDPRLQKVRDFAPHTGAVTAVSPSLRDKGFLTADAAGGVAVHYSTSHRTLFTIPGDGAPVLAAMLAPKTDGAVVFRDDGRLAVFDVENDHPEVTLSSLFMPVLYEGYDVPKAMWQSTGGSDAFEPKFGLWPLMFGTLKGTMYAMLLAAPIAVLGAIYTAMFMRPAVRAVIKPVVETMAAFPTVILGFLAGLWLAPLLETIFPAVVAVFLVLPPVVVSACVGWHYLPSRFNLPSGTVTELVACMVVLGGTVWVCVQGNQQIEAWLFDSNYRQWMLSTFGLEYDQRNALVIAFAMGMAVIPVIFSISEDALSNVPRHLIAGSLALGATPWQTLTKLVMVSASPGVFSALMIGLGRVVGETMIVLMATGNTPLLEMNLLNGFRTLSANIAVEMPEAPQGGTLYRLLFLAGLMLFVFTFLVNTVADVVRQRLRVRYGQF